MATTRAGAETALVIRLTQMAGTACFPARRALPSVDGCLSRDSAGAGVSSCRNRVDARQPYAGAGAGPVPVPVPRPVPRPRVRSRACAAQSAGHQVLRSASSTSAISSVSSPDVDPVHDARGHTVPGRTSGQVRADDVRSDSSPRARIARGPACSRSAPATTRAARNRHQVAVAPFQARLPGFSKWSQAQKGVRTWLARRVARRLSFAARAVRRQIAANRYWTTIRVLPSGSRSQNSGGTGPPMRLTSGSTSIPLLFSWAW